jgi:hypothetical protein
MEEIQTGNVRAIIDFTKTKPVDVSAGDFVWDATEWDATVTAPAAHKRITAFKLCVSKACFLKVWVYGNAAPAVEYFPLGESNKVCIKVLNDNVHNLDQDTSAAFNGSGHVADITAGTNW